MSMIGGVFGRAIAVVAILASADRGYAGTGPFNVKEVRYDKEIVYLFPTASVPNTKSCDASSAIILKVGDPGFEQMYGMALTALVSGKKLQCWERDCVASAWSGSTRPRVYGCGLLAD